MSAGIPGQARQGRHFVPRAGNSTGQLASDRDDGNQTPVTPNAVAQQNVARREIAAQLSCDTCAKPLTLKAAAVVDLDQAARRAARFRLWRARGSPDGGRPPLVPWTFQCVACVADRDKDSTFIVRVEKLSSDRQLLRQTLRITSKPWAAQTGWAAMVLRILRAQ